MLLTTRGQVIGNHESTKGSGGDKVDQSSEVILYLLHELREATSKH